MVSEKMLEGGWEKIEMYLVQIKDINPFISLPKIPWTSKVCYYNPVKVHLK